VVESLCEYLPSCSVLPAQYIAESPSQDTGSEITLQVDCLAPALDQHIGITNWQLRLLYLRTINSMLENAKIYFSDEENLMISSGLYPPYIKEHQSMHREFFEEARSLAETENYISQQQAKKVMNYLVDWLAYHILGLDHGMARQIDAVQNGQSPEEAYKDEVNDPQKGTEPFLTALKGLFQEVTQRNRELRDLNQTLEQQVSGGMKTFTTLQSNFFPAPPSIHPSPPAWQYSRPCLPPETFPCLRSWYKQSVQL